jgi:hypothetical protein
MPLAAALSPRESVSHPWAMVIFDTLEKWREVVCTKLSLCSEHSDNAEAD